MSPDSAAVAGEVGVVQHVVVEAVGGQEVAAVVGLVERPVVAQALGHQHQHAVIAQLVVLDDGQRLEGLTEADAVGDDAAAEALQLVDGADDAVALELEELLPDDGVADAGGGLDDALFVQFVAEVLEEVVEGQVVDERRRLVLGQRLQTRRGTSPWRPVVAEGCSTGRRTKSRGGAFLGVLGALDEAELVAGRQPKAVVVKRSARDDAVRQAVVGTDEPSPIAEWCRWPA